MRNSKQSASDFIDKAVLAVKTNLQKGYYDSVSKTSHEPVSLRNAIVSCRKIPVIAEIKFHSPSAGAVREVRDVEQIAQAMVRGGAVGISVLTEPTFFKGSLNYLQRVRRVTEIPLLMKDFIIDRRQVDAGASAGADAVLLIAALYYAATNIGEMIDYTHQKGLEVLLEVHDKKEFHLALETDADVIGINNRDLRTLKTDISTTENILRGQMVSGRIIISESGFHDVGQLKNSRAMGVSGFLIGSSIIQLEDIESKLKSLIEV